MKLSHIDFGELDAKHEVFSQAREGSYLLMNAFQMPPSVRFESLTNGSKFFVSGLKGTGKTSLLLYIRHHLEMLDASTHTVLFKSKLTESERQRISNVNGISAFTDQSGVPFQYDYKQNWLWYIITEIVRLIRDEDVVHGHEYIKDLRHVTGVNQKARQSIFSGIQLTKFKGVVDNAVKAGPLTSSMKAELEGVFSSKEQKFIEIVDICEHALSQVRIRSDRRIALFFDELELFANKVDQRDRDLNLIRDILYAVSRINQSIGAENPEICVYAAVRTEVLFEVNRVGPEIQRDVEDFGVSINWIGKSQSEELAILKIVENKINRSEAESGAPQTLDVWETYFENELFSKPTKQYLLDVSMYKPRTLVSLLSSVAEQFPDADKITDEQIGVVESAFSSQMWREVEEELRTSYSAEDVQAIKSLITGMNRSFTIENLIARADSLSGKNPRIKSCLGTRDKMEMFIRTLYRVGAIGNFFHKDEKRRDGWVFRDFAEPQMAQKFQFHESLRKTLQVI